MTEKSQEKWTTFRSLTIVIDKIVEECCLGDVWESLLIDMTNEMAEDVLYALSKLDFTVYDGSQKIFQELLDAPIRSLVSQNITPA